MIYVFLGAPGAGKGTISELLKKYGFIHLSTGDIFRDLSKKKEDKLAQEVNKLISQGKLINDKLTFKLVKNELEKYDLKTQKIILDGYPRTLKQAKMLTRFLKKINIKIDYVINLVVNRDIIIERLSNRLICPNCSRTYHFKDESLRPKIDGECDACHTKLIRRKDDEPSKINYRLDIYDEFSKKIIAFYHKQEIIYDIDGTKGKEIILKDILSISNESNKNQRTN